MEVFFISILLYLRKILLRFEPWIVAWQDVQLVVFSLKFLCHWGAKVWQLKHRSAVLW
jgi:hypothetical protein